MRWLLFLLVVFSAHAATNSYGHITVTWDTVTNAQWYSVIVRTNGVEVMRRYSMTNQVAVSNLLLPLEQYRFTAIATNSLGESAEITSEIIKWVTVTNQWSTNLIDWQDLVTNSFVPELPKEFFRMSISNFDASTLWKPDYNL